MLCEKCKKKEATIHLIKLVGGEKSEVWLCEECAKDMSEMPIIPNLDGKEVSLQHILGGFFEALNRNKEKKVEVVCKKCGLTYSQFKKSGQLGCNECYDSFTESLKPLIKRMQGDLEHIGKIPKKTGNKFIELKRINRLKQELQRCIECEDYEKAAVIRDEIKMLTEEKKGGNGDEKLDL